MAPQLRAGYPELVTCGVRMTYGTEWTVVCDRPAGHPGAHRGGEGYQFAAWTRANPDRCKCGVQYPHRCAE